MKANFRQGTLIAAAVAFGLFLPAAARAAGAKAIQAAQGGVRVRVVPKGFQGDVVRTKDDLWETIPAEKLPKAVTDDPVLFAANRVALLSRGSGSIHLLTRVGDSGGDRGTITFDNLDALAPDNVGAFGRYNLVRGGQPPRLGVEVYGRSDRLEFTVYLSDDGVFEFVPGAARQLNLQLARLDYGILPSLVGTDLVYTPKTGPGLDRLYVPSMNLMVGLVSGNDCMMVGVWPPGRQLVSFQTGNTGAPEVRDNGLILGRKTLDRFTIDLDGKSFHLGWLEHRGIWHVEPLQPGYLERDKAIAWRRPFEAKWIGRFQIASEEIDFPFYFRHERAKLWGRCIRGWFGYPVWFDGPQTMIHFEKSFPPKGELLVYYLEDHPKESLASPVGSPVGIMAKALGRQQAAKLLDFEGVDGRLLLKHGNAVCAMTNTVQKYFDDGRTAEHRDVIRAYCGDVSDFIAAIRRRIEEFAAFSASMRQLLADRAKANPKLAEAAASLGEILDEMDQLLKTGMPRASLDEVRSWTVTMNDLAGQSGPQIAKKYGTLAEQCRSVAGSQDDLARDLSIRTIRIFQEAARQGVPSPERVRLAEEVIAKARQVLRKPTWWEPQRNFVPKSDPGRP